MAMNPFEQASGLMTSGANTTTGIAESSFMDNINQYINPFYDQVLNSALGRQNDAYQSTLTQLGDSAQQAGAFGGSRHGITEGVLGSEYNKNVGELTGALGSQGFNTAVNMSQADRAQMLGAAQQQMGMGGQFFNTGQSLLQQQGAAGVEQQNLAQGILTGGQRQYQNEVSSPYQIIDLFNALMQSDPRRQAGQATGTSTPGLFDYLSLAAGVGGSVFQGTG